MISKKMFEELGYRRDYIDKSIRYTKPEDKPYVVAKEIWFNPEKKKVTFCHIDVMGEPAHFGCSPDELQAIFQQCKELKFI